MFVLFLFSSIQPLFCCLSLAFYLLFFLSLSHSFALFTFLRSSFCSILCLVVLLSFIVVRLLAFIIFSNSGGYSLALIIQTFFLLHFIVLSPKPHMHKCDVLRSACSRRKLNVSLLYRFVWQVDLARFFFLLLLLAVLLLSSFIEYVHLFLIVWPFVEFNQNPVTFIGKLGPISLLIDKRTHFIFVLVSIAT